MALWSQPLLSCILVGTSCAPGVARPRGWVGIIQKKRIGLVHESYDFKEKSQPFFFSVSPENPRGGSRGIGDGTVLGQY